ncbi:MAG: tetratricopeptide repeat protein [Bacteroidetes bacterium]|nr:tetratricopeptide repeat protein [Bacteroidota bacterium]
MNPLHRFALSLILVLTSLLTSCGNPAKESSDIPITTVSEEARAAFIQGRDALEVGRSDEARALFDKAIAADAAFAQAYLLRARTATSAPDWKTHADLAVAHRASASPGEQILIDMFSAMMEDDIDKELTLATQLVKDFPESARAQQVLADTYAGRKNITEARAAMEAAINLDPSWSVPHRAMANSFVFDEPRDLTKAEKHASRYVELKPQEADAHIMLGDVYRAEINLEKARTSYAKAAQADPSSAVALSKKGHAETFLGNYAEARADFEDAAEKSKTWKIGAKNFGVYTWLYAGDVKAALAANQAVIDDIATLVPDRDQQKQALSVCYEARCRIAAEAGDFTAAADAFARHAALDRETAAAMQNESFSKSTESQLAQLEGMTAAAKGDFATAVTMADKAEAQARGLNSPGALDGVNLLRGIIALREGNPQAALKHFAASGTNMIEVKYYSALAHEALGEKDEAAKLFTDVANWNFNDLGYALVRSKAIAKLSP